jgi:hypothetical protein
MRPSGIVLLALAFVLSAAAPGMAYVGPGAGLTAIGAAVAFLGAIVLAVIGFIWYPIKRLLRGRTAREGSDTPQET